MLFEFVNFYSLLNINSTNAKNAETAITMFLKMYAKDEVLNNALK